MFEPRALVARTATLTRPSHVGIVRRAAVSAADDMTRTLEVCLVPWGETARVSDDGRTFYDETWATGSLTPADLVAVFDGHRPTLGGVERGEVIGAARSIEDRPDGLFATLELADTNRGRDTYALARTLGQVHVSIEADVPPADGATVARSADAPGVLTGVAVCWPPHGGAFAGAVGAARSSPEPDPEPAEPETPPDDTITRAQLDEAVRTGIARFALVRGGPAADPSPLARFGSFDELHAAVRSAPRDEAADLGRHFTTAYQTYRTATAARVFADQIIADNPGLVPPSWLTEVFGLVDRGRPSITALGGPRSAGSTGLDVYWPYYAGDLTTIVGEQTAPKTEVTSVKVSFLRGQATLKTYAGGSDVAYQLQRRSSPGYMALYDRILQMAYAVTTENAFVDAVVAGAGHTLVLVPLTANAAAIRAFLFQASAHVRTVTGAPASVVLVASDVFAAWGSLPDLMPSAYGTSNVSGTAQANTLAIDVNGMTITEAPMAPAGSVVVTNDQAAAWLEEGPFLASSEDVAKLGTDVAIWGMGAPGLFLPAAIVKASPTLGTRGGSK